MTAFCGDVPHQIPPLEMSEVSDSLQYGGVIESDNLICGGHGGVLWALLKHYCFTAGHHFDEC